VNVAITTTVDRAEALAAEFELRGMRPVVLPCVAVQIAPPIRLSKARNSLDGADTLLLSSPRSLSIMWPNGSLPDLPVVAVGPATATAAHRSGLTVEVVGTGGLADVVDSLQGRRVFFPRAESTPEAPLRRLADVAASLEAPVVYRTVPRAPEDEPVDAVAFTSPTAVEGWLMTRTLDDVAVGVIGETTAAAVRAHRIEPDVTPARPGFALLAEAFAERYL